ncbi:unnamed protein product, partial [Iphiclides podalirius]
MVTGAAAALAERSCAAAARAVEAAERLGADAAAALPGDLEALQALLRRAPDAAAALDAAAAELQGNEAERAQELQRRAAQLQRRAAQLQRDLPQQLQRVRDAHARTERLLQGIDDLEEFLHGLERQMPSAEECTIRDSAELYRMKSRFQALKEQCDERSTQFRSLNEEGNEMMLAAERRAAALARRLTQLCALWSRNTHAVYERYKVLAEAWHESGELRAWLSQQGAWLDGLQRRLQPAPPRADAEDISDELYDLENYMQNHSDERLERIHTIGRQLVEAHIMPEWIQAELDAVSARWAALRRQGEERARQLEAAARDAAQSELALERLQQWAEAARARPPGADLAAELPAQRRQLEELQQRAPPQGAARMQHQLQLVQRQLDELERRLGAGPWGAAASSPLEARLHLAQAALREVQLAAAALPPAAPAPPDPDAVRAQLRNCLKLYRTLSEIKSEVESIIKSGRKAAEERAVAEPQELSKRIDALKELYNKLGAQITEAKTRLEGALLAARELQSDLQALTGWLDGRGAGLARQPLELEMSRMEAVRRKLHANFALLAPSAERHALRRLEAQLAHVDARWLALAAPALKDDGERESDVVVEYENVTDTIKRRLESPVDTPETERPELKRSKIPLALKSPVPIKKEVKEGGNRSRGASLERAKKSADSGESGAGSARSVDSAEAQKGSSTFNLLEDSDLFSRISNNQVETAEPAQHGDEPKADSYHVVEVKEREIVKSTVSPIELKEIYPSEAVETVVEFIPQTVERVEIIDDTEGESICDSDSEEARVSVDFGSEPTTFVVEVQKFEERMKPTLGILKRRNGGEDVSMGTPPPTPTPTPTAEEGDEGEGQAIYAEVGDTPQTQVTSASDFDDKPPLSTSTPIKQEAVRQQAQVVGVARKAAGVDEKYQKSDEFEQESRSEGGGGAQGARGAEGAEGARGSLVGARFPAACAADPELARFEAAALAMARRLHVMLLTVGGVASERDPAKRLEILKNQLGAVAPDAAALISRGDSLVYAKHKENPQLAEFLRTRFQDELRGQWSTVMAEIEAKRNAAIKAEDDVKEVAALTERLQRWARDGEPSEAAARAADAERLQALSRELRAQRVAFAERAAASAARAALARAEQEAAPADSAEAERRVAELEARAAAACLRTAELRAGLAEPPLGPQDYDQFPLQEDALEKLKSSISELNADIEDIERHRSELSRTCGAERAERLQRARDRLQQERTKLDAAFGERYERWLRCRAGWGELYAALEAANAALDEGALGAGAEGAQGAPGAGAEGAQGALVERAAALGRGVLAACGGALAADVAAQLQALQRRAAAAERVRRVRELLLTTSANPSDHTSLSIRLSLVKVSPIGPPFAAFLDSLI